MPVKHARSHMIVAVGKNRRSHHDFLAGNAPDRMTSPVNLRGHILNYDALAAIAQLHGHSILNGKHDNPGNWWKQRIERAAQRTPKFANQAAVIRDAGKRGRVC